MRSRYIKTEHNWFLMIFGAFFAIPAVGMLFMHVIPRLYHASQKYSAWSSIERELMGETGMALIFVFIFGVVGFSIMKWGWSGLKVNTSPEAFDKPWLSKPEWMDNKIYSGSKAALYITAFFAVTWNLLTWPMAFFNLNKAYQEEGIWLAALMAAFPVIGLFIIFLFYKRLKEWVRFGRLALVLNPFPGAIGGQVGGTIALPSTLKNAETYKVTLSCIKKYYRNRGSERRLLERLVWQSERNGKVLSRGEGRVLAFKFNVPENLPVSDINQGQSWHIWRVHVESSKSGLDRDYEIPVFNTKEGSTVNVSIDERQEEVEENKLVRTFLPLVNSVPATGQSALSTHSEQRIIHYPMFYRASHKLLFVAFGGSFFIVSIIMRNEAPLFMTAIFGLVGSTLLLASLYHLLCTFTVKMDHQRISTTQSFLGIFTTEKKTAVKNIKAIRPKEVMRSESSGRHTIHYNVVASLYHGEDMLLAKQIEGKRVSKAIINYFHESLGINQEVKKPMDKSERKKQKVLESVY